MTISILFNAINVLNMQTNSVVTIGENAQTGWDSHGKSNIGNGSFLGVSLNSANLVTIIDPDIIDAPINDQDVKPTWQIQQV
ncbi:MAG: spore germination protein [Tepidanaerobacteraceae bacterium]|nr:spore germination protein [Tepidanaerobacteraceae bacterium]